MRTLQWLYEKFLQSMLVIAGVALVWLMVAVVLSVLQRNLGMQSWAWLFLSTEYGMFYLTLLGAPWLVRHRGHVHIELITASLPKPVLNGYSRFIALLAALICAILAFKGYELVMMNLERGDMDVRAYFFPTWMLSIAFPVSFGLMTIEFLRFVIGKELLHTGVAGVNE
jgi:TRAP-type C4-dicarboxylate transport system permease small subunit